MHFNYIFWLISFVFLPLMLLWARYYNYLKRYKRTLLGCVVLAVVFSFPWDVVAVKLSIWSFPKSSLLGIWVYTVPIEEFIFYTSVTLLYATVTLVIKMKIEQRSKKHV